jgi:hypothetical protein
LNLRELWNSVFRVPASRRGRTGAYPALREDSLAPTATGRRPALSPLGVLGGLALAAAAAAVLDYGVLPPPLGVREKAPADFRARVDFDFESSQWFEERRKQAADEALFVYRPVAEWEAGLLKDLKRICEIIERAGSAEEAVSEARMEMPGEDKLVSALYEYHGRHRLETLAAGFLSPLEVALRSQARGGVVDDEAHEAIAGKKGRKALWRLEAHGARREVPLAEARRLDKALTDLDINHLQPRRFSENLRTALLAYLGDHLKANLVHDREASLAERERARESVTSAVQRFPRGAVLVAKDSIVDSEMLRLLNAEARAAKAGQPLLEHAARLVGLFLLSAAVLFFCLLGFQRLHITEARRRPFVMLGLTSLAVLALARLFLVHGLPAQCAPVAIATVAASLAFSSGAALLAALALSLLVGFAAEGNLPLTLALLLGGAVAAIPARKLEHRWDLIRYGALGGLAQGLTVAGLSQLGRFEFAADQFPAWRGMGSVFPPLSEALWGLLNCPACGLLLLGGLPVLEWAFGIVTNIRLLELADQNQPALRRIMLEAPGTWAHSLQVATLCEPAAEAVGANARLVRTGVYFHDLGKTLKPEYFVENQRGAEELHRRLSPSVSVLIIVSHVKDGIELAREYGLPPQIIAFIPEHHGTTLVKYFYHTARQKAQAGKGAPRDVQESFFRYPGPKPQSRETAIVMLADTVEAASRTLEAPSATRLRGFVHEMIMQKLLDGQLDECDLTFRDLAVIEDVFIRVLVSRFHARVRYPGQEPEPPKPLPGDAAHRPASTPRAAAPPATPPVPVAAPAVALDATPSAAAATGEPRTDPRTFPPSPPGPQTSQ